MEPGPAQLLEKRHFPSIKGDQAKEDLERFFREFLKKINTAANASPREEPLFILLWFLSEGLANAVKSQQVFRIARNSGMNIAIPPERDAAYRHFSEIKLDRDAMAKLEAEIIQSGEEPVLELSADSKNNRFQCRIENQAPLSELDRIRFRDRVALALEKKTIIDAGTGIPHSTYATSPDQIKRDTHGGGANVGIYTVTQSIDIHFGLEPGALTLFPGDNGKCTILQLRLDLERLLSTLFFVDNA